MASSPSILPISGLAGIEVVEIHLPANVVLMAGVEDHAVVQLQDEAGFLRQDIQGPLMPSCHRRTYKRSRPRRSARRCRG